MTGGGGMVIPSVGDGSGKSFLSNALLMGATASPVHEAFVASTTND